jgi:Ca2+-dependent lipid-binding protein
MKEMCVQHYLNSSSSTVDCTELKSQFPPSHCPSSPRGKSHNDLTSLSLHHRVESIARQKLASLYASLGWSMRPSVFFFLSVLPLVVYFHSSSLYLCCLSLGFVTLYCLYCYSVQLQRQRVTCALGVISDPDVLELVSQFMPGWVLSTEKNRVDWCNHLLTALWPMIGSFAEYKISTKAKEIFQKEKPELLTSMELTQVVAGTVSPKIISIRILDTSSTTDTAPHKPKQVRSLFIVHLTLS